MFDTYQQNAITTLSDNIKYNLDPRLAYTLKGISGEAGEVLTKIWFQRISLEDLEMEVGDCFWYCAASSYLMGKKFSEVCRTPVMNIFDLETNLRMLSVAGLKLSEITKKCDRDGLTQERLDGIIDLIADITSYLRYLVNYYKLDTRRILDRNIYKLKSRKERDQIHGDGDYR